MILPFPLFTSLSSRRDNNLIAININSNIPFSHPVIPSGILKWPFFDADLPAYLNYGAIGMVIGHEITHSFDNLGSQFGKEGNIENWWTVETKKRFDEKTKCFVDQYGAITDKITGLPVSSCCIQDPNSLILTSIRFVSIARRRTIPWRERRRQWRHSRGLFRTGGSGEEGRNATDAAHGQLLDGAALLSVLWPGLV